MLILIHCTSAFSHKCIFAQVHFQWPRLYAKLCTQYIKNAGCQQARSPQNKLVQRCVRNTLGMPAVNKASALIKAKETYSVGLWMLPDAYSTNEQSQQNDHCRAVREEYH